MTTGAVVALAVTIVIFLGGIIIGLGKWGVSQITKSIDELKAELAEITKHVTNNDTAVQLIQYRLGRVEEICKSCKKPPLV